MTDTLGQREVASTRVQSVQLSEADMAAEQLELLQEQMAVHLAGGGTACASLTWNVMLSAGSPSLEMLREVMSTLSLHAAFATHTESDGSAPDAGAYERHEASAVASTLRGKPVVMRGTRRWSSPPLNEQGRPAIWRFTSQDGGKVVPA